MSIALALDFLSSESLDGRVTASGAANGTRVNSAGAIVAATCPRYDYDPVTLAPKGVMREEARTNLFLNSLLNGTSLSTQDVTVTAQVYTISFYGSGSITLSGAHTATINGSGAYPARATYSFTPSAGTLTCTVSGTVQFANCEAGTFATSFIPTAGSSVTRSADSLSMTGTNFSSWHNASEGTYIVEFSYFGSGINRRVLVAHDGTANDEHLLGISTGEQPAFLEWDGGALQANLSSTAVTPGSIVRMAAAYKLHDFALCSNGGTVATDTSGTVASPTTLNIGAEFSSSPLNGHFRRIVFDNTRRSNADLQAVTASAITGAAAITEGADTVTATGQVKVTGAAAITEGADTASASGEVGAHLVTPPGRIASPAV